MQKNSRIYKIEKMLLQNGSLEVSELSKLFDVSEMTIRRDLNILVSKGKAIRTHGGATIPQETYIDGVSFIERSKEHIYEKRIIAKEAVNYLNSGDNIFVDDSSTALYMAEYIPSNKPLIVTTTSITAALEFNKHQNITVFCIGGELHKSYYSCFGPITQNALEGMYFKSAFLGFCSITEDGLITTNSVNDLKIKKIVLQRCESSYALIDSSKIKPPQFFQFGSISELDTIITDSKINSSFIECCKNNNVDLVLAGS